MKLLLLIFRNLRRSMLRTTLTALGTIVLVMVVTLVWSILYFLDNITAEKSRNLKAIVTERWQMRSLLPYSYATTLQDAAATRPDDVHPDDAMTWQFYGGTLDPANRTRENFMFAFAMEPKKLATMMDDLEDLKGSEKQELDDVIAKLEQKPDGIVVGQERLDVINKRIGERIKIYSLNYKDIDLEFEIVGTFPIARYNQSAAFNRDYLNRALENYERTHGQKHSMADKSLNLVWMRVPDREAFQRAADQVTNSPLYTNPAVKCETASSGIANFLEAFRDLIWGMRWMLAPAILVTLSLVLANAIGISVRERRTEMAILKVLGFRPANILALVLGEALIIGILSGMISAGGTYLIINNVFGGLKFPIAFFPAFLIPGAALWWGFAVGAVTALIGSIVPAWTACSIKVSEVFAKVD